MTRPRSLAPWLAIVAAIALAAAGARALRSPGDRAGCPEAADLVDDPRAVLRGG